MTLKEIENRIQSIIKELEVLERKEKELERIVKARRNDLSESEQTSTKYYWVSCESANIISYT